MRPRKITLANNIMPLNKCNNVALLDISLKCSHDQGMFFFS